MALFYGHCTLLYKGMSHRWTGHENRTGISLAHCAVPPAPWPAPRRALNIHLTGGKKSGHVFDINYAISPSQKTVKLKKQISVQIHTLLYGFFFPFNLFNIVGRTLFICKETEIGNEGIDLSFTAQ